MIYGTSFPRIKDLRFEMSHINYCHELLSLRKEILQNHLFTTDGETFHNNLALLGTVGRALTLGTLSLAIVNLAFPHQVLQQSIGHEHQQLLNCKNER